MREPRPTVIVIWTRGDATAPDPRATVADLTRAARVLRHCEALSRQGFHVELWTRQCRDRAATERLGGGLRVRRLSCGDCGSVREQTPAEYVAEFIACAAERLEGIPAAATTLLSHYWDAGVAGKLLAVRFGLAHVHVPHALAVEERPLPAAADAPSSREMARRLREERETCRGATRVIAASVAQRNLLVGEVYEVPPEKVVVGMLHAEGPGPCRWAFAGGAAVVGTAIDPAPDYALSGDQRQVLDDRPGSLELFTTGPGGFL